MADVAADKDAEPAPREHFNTGYELFILVLTVHSLVLMALSLLPLNEAVLQLLLVSQNCICVVFLIDFALNLRKARTKREYLIGQRGWLDLLGSLPTLGVFSLSALLRLARLSRLTRMQRLMQRQNQKQIVQEVLHNRGQYAALVTVLLAFIVLSSASVLVLWFEAPTPGANITTGGDAMWWAIVTITTVGYGDKYPITAVGRITAVFVMVAGVGIIGTLAGILSGVLLSPPAAAADHEDNSAAELEAIRNELAALRSALQQQR